MIKIDNINSLVREDLDSDELVDGIPYTVTSIGNSFNKEYLNAIFVRHADNIAAFRKDGLVLIYTVKDFDQFAFLPINNATITISK